MDLGIKIVLVPSLVRSWGRRRRRRRLKDGRLFSFFNSPCSYIFTVASLQPFLHSLSLFVDISTSLYLSLPLSTSTSTSFALLLGKNQTLFARNSPFSLSLSFLERIAVFRCAPLRSSRSALQNQYEVRRCREKRKVVSLRRERSRFFTEHSSINSEMLSHTAFAVISMSTCRKCILCFSQKQQSY